MTDTSHTQHLDTPKNDEELLEQFNDILMGYHLNDAEHEHILIKSNRKMLTLAQARKTLLDLFKAYIKGTTQTETPLQDTPKGDEELESLLGNPCSICPYCEYKRQGECSNPYKRCSVCAIILLLIRKSQAHTQRAIREARRDELQKALDTHLWNDGMGIYLKEGIEQLSPTPQTNKTNSEE